MGYEIIKNVTDEQFERVQKDSNHTYNRDKICIVRANGQDIGYFMTFFVCGRLTIEYYLFKDFQHKGYGTQFVNVLTDWICSENPSYDTVYLLIYYENIPSTRVALKNGYSMNYDDWDFREVVNDEMPNHYVYSKKNPYYTINGPELKKVHREVKKGS